MNKFLETSVRFSLDLLVSSGPFFLDLELFIAQFYFAPFKFYGAFSVELCELSN